MKKILSAVCAAALCFSAAAHALEVKVENLTKAKVVMAFSYLDSEKNEWVVDGWYNVEPLQTAKIDLNSANDIYYLYAEFSNGKKLEGGKGSIALKVKNQSFIYSQARAPKELDRKVNFVRARGNSGKALVRIK